METQALELITPATAYPVNLEEAKIHLRMADLDEEDALITNLIQAATEQAEAFTQRRFMTQTWKLFQDDFSCGEEPNIRIPYPPIQSLTHVKYYDSAGTLTTMALDVDYSFDSKKIPAQIVPAPSTVWPTVQYDKKNAVEVQFVCGYTSAANVPGSIKAAILLILAHFFEHRQELVIGNIVNTIPKASEWLLWPYRDIRNL